MNSAGVPLGTANPNQLVVTNSGTPDSLAVGTPDKAAERLAVVTAKARNLPPLTGPMAVGEAAMTRSKEPDCKAKVASLIPRNGMWATLILASALKRSVTM